MDLLAGRFGLPMAGIAIGPSRHSSVSKRGSTRWVRVGTAGVRRPAEPYGPGGPGPCSMPTGPRQSTRGLHQHSGGAPQSLDGPPQSHGGQERAGPALASVALWIQPRGGHDAVIGERDGRVVIRLQAPPVDGAANAALIRFLVRGLGCPARAGQLLRGERGRRKWVAVEGIGAAELRRRLLALRER